MGKPRAVGLLNGSGGMHIGFENAGFDTVSVAEVDNDYGKSMKLNRPDIPIHEDPDWDDFIETTGNEEEDLALVYGHPPCQGYTGLNANAGSDNAKNELATFFMTHALALRPQYIVFENIPRMLTMGRHIVDQIAEMSDQQGYTMTIHKHRVGDFGVSQIRQRVLYLFERNNKSNRLLMFPPHETQETPTVMDVISDLQVVKPGSQRDWNTDKGLVYQNKPKNHWQEKLRNGSDKIYNHVIMHDVPEFMSHVPEGKQWSTIDHDLMPDKYRKKVEEGRLFNAAEMTRLDGSKVGTTITSAKCKLHPKLNRLITTREAARMMGFPDTWKFSKPTDLSQVAAGVCPPVAEWFGKVLIESLD